MDEVKDCRLLKQGAEARIYVGKFLAGMTVVIKERFSKKYRHPHLDCQLTKERLRGEVRSLMRCKLIGVRTPTIFAVDEESGVLVMEYVDAPTCRDFINENLERDNRPKLLELSAELGRLISTLHKNNVIHGDITTSNILVEKSDPIMSLCLIDFGLGFAEGTREDKAVDLYVLERALFSTHPNTEFMFEEIMKAYKDEMKDRKKDCDGIVKKFEEVRSRGRKREMIG